MIYFYNVFAQADRDNEISFYVVPPENKENPQDVPKITADTIKQNPAYADFGKKKFPLVMVNCTVYKTESDLTEVKPVNLDEHLKSLIESKEAEFVANSELQITSKGGGKKKKKKISTKMMGLIIAGAATLSLIVGVGVGTALGSKSGGGSGVIITENDDSNRTDGLIMPDEVQFDPNAKLITVSIDRSWSAVPREDLQVKGEIVSGVAKITLPAFDRTDFFSHVTGYTWGFTSDPAGKKIEYYGGGTYEFTENIKLYRVLVKYGGGNGTKDDPYLINYYDQLQLLSEKSAQGYFRQTEDIFFPSWTANSPINTVNTLKEKNNLPPEALWFEYDGGGFRIEGLTAPLFGTVSGSVIKNVNITGALIETTAYENHGFIVSEAYNYRYEVDGITYETGETLIKNCTVSHSSMYLKYPETEGNVQTVPPVTAPPPVVPPDLELPEDDTPPPPPKHGEFAIGGISGIGGQIENCLVTDVVIAAELDDYFLYAGGISGKPANVINSGVSYLTIRGKIFHAGGIAGSAGGSRMYNANGEELPLFYGGNIQGCFVRNFAGYVENSAGGIAGEASANAENPLISNSYATYLDLRVGIFDDDERKIPIKLGISGGIVGTDGNENYGHLITNTVSIAYYPVIGSAVKSAYDDTVRLAPYDAFYQTGILDVLNKNTVHPNNPSIIFTGDFMFAKDERNNDDGGGYAFPLMIIDLFEKTEVRENDK